MISKFIETTIRRNVWQLFRNENSVHQSWGFNGVPDGYYDLGLNSIDYYKVSEIIFEIITKIYMLSIIKLPKKEIIHNLKKRYKEDDIMNAISFLEKKKLLNEYLGIPHNQDTVVLTIYHRCPIYLKNFESKKFYGISIDYSKEIAKIVSKKPKDEHSHCLHICSEPIAFYKVPNDERNVDLRSSLDSIYIYKDIFDKFMSKTCVVESSFELRLFYDKAHLSHD